MWPSEWSADQRSYAESACEWNSYLLGAARVRVDVEIEQSSKGAERQRYLRVRAVLDELQRRRWASIKGSAK
jgi:hypothetical protein